ncbi:hypothetical protein OF83DRAFT_1114949 [Amylostereum chailletii]|nr:hypothetical protein OF83DRAFT_1114949 [Amylostereum chailletii]
MDEENVSQSTTPSHTSGTGSATAPVTARALPTLAYPDSPSIISRFPTEILMEIFSYLPVDDQTPPKWVDVSYVCRWWRVVALDHGTLWTQLPLQSPNWTKVFLQRSKAALISLSTLFPRPDGRFLYYDSMRLVLPELYRLVNLVLLDKGDDEWQDFIHYAFSEVARSSLPVLQRFIIWSIDGRETREVTTDIPDALFATNSPPPSLHEVSLQSCNLSSACPLFSPNLTTLIVAQSRIGTRLEDLLAVLSRLPKLQNLQLSDVVSGLDDGPSAGFGSNSVPLLNLFYLTISEDIYITGSLMQCLVIPQQAHVNLHCRQLPQQESFVVQEKIERLASVLFTSAVEAGLVMRNVKIESTSSKFSLITANPPSLSPAIAHRPIKATSLADLRERGAMRRPSADHNMPPNPDLFQRHMELTIEARPPSLADFPVFFLRVQDRLPEMAELHMFTYSLELETSDGWLARGRSRQWQNLESVVAQAAGAVALAAALYRASIADDESEDQPPFLPMLAYINLHRFRMEQPARNPEFDEGGFLAELDGGDGDLDPEMTVYEVLLEALKWRTARFGKLLCLELRSVELTEEMETQLSEYVDEEGIFICKND